MLDISTLKGYWTLDGPWFDQFDRPADIHLLAWHPERNPPVGYHRAPEKWLLFVMPTWIVRARETSIGLAGLEELTKAIGYPASTVEAWIDGHVYAFAFFVWFRFHRGPKTPPK